MERPTMAAVAKAAGVSTALVSIVMREVPGASDQTRERVKAVADELGYVPDQRARQLRQRSSRLLGVTFELRQPFHGDVVEQMYAAAAAHGYDLAISAVAPTRDERTALEALVRERCEAAVLLGSGLQADDLADVATRVPVLLVARAGADGVPAVHGDEEAGVRLAVEHVAGLGHTEVVHVDGGSAPGAAERRRGFTAAAAALGLGSRVVPGGPTEEDGARAAQGLLDAPPTAIVAFNDHCASGVIDVLLRAGRDVPGDVSVVGYDDSRLATARQTQMTTVAQSAVEIAERAVAGALALVAGERPDDVVIAPRLVVRSTTAPPRA